MIISPLFYDEDVSDNGDGDDDVMCTQNNGNVLFQSEEDLFLCQMYIGLHDCLATTKKRKEQTFWAFNWSKRKNLLNPKLPVMFSCFKC